MHSFWYDKPWLDLREKYLLAEITVIAGAVVFRKKRSCKSFFRGAGKVTRPWERDHEIRDNIVTTRTTVLEAFAFNASIEGIFQLRSRKLEAAPSFRYNGLYIFNPVREGAP